MSRPLVSVDWEAVPAIASVTVYDFCKTYHLSESIQSSLVKAGYKSANQLLLETNTTLEKTGFKTGHIATIKTALAQFVEVPVFCERKMEQGQKDVGVLAAGERHLQASDTQLS